ncbi:MAG: FtsK/SpoIIIE domain-containing protein, partial [Gemmataceae bacterium]
PPALATDPVGKLEKCLEDVSTATERLRDVRLPRLTNVPIIITLIVVPTVLAGAIGLIVGGTPKVAFFAGIWGLLFLSLPAVFGLRYFAKKQVKDRALALGVFQAEAARAVVTLENHAEGLADKQRRNHQRRHQEESQTTRSYYEPRLRQLGEVRQVELDRAEVEHQDRTQQIQSDRDVAFAAETRRDEAERRAGLGKLDTELRQAEALYHDRQLMATTARDDAWQKLSLHWHAELQATHAAFLELQEHGTAAFCPWATLAEANTPLAHAVPAGIRFGELNVDLAALPEGEPLDERLTPKTPLAWKLPAFLPFPDAASVMIPTQDEGRPRAIKLLQAIMLRFLTGLPPGKVRFTIIDPVGLGENFAAFMNLADFDEQLVGPRIWTESAQIDQRLLDTTEHMENVIQKYLRNQYASIEDYNRAAGEVAEPYRVLVIANFPTNFTPEAARRLISIMSSGPACGVCTLVSLDTKASFPRDFRLKDMEQVAFQLKENAGVFRSARPELAPFGLTVDAPPEPAIVAQLVRRVGAASRDASRVEVPFDFIMPTANEAGNQSSARGFQVPIGRAGATKRQMFVLGRGTAQHALVAGKTGSGKSTLLHALITNLALHYSPEEAELYLIDFKKGVEFKAYADYRLPQARVIAIESEREFGLSVLQRLDGLLR